MLQNPTLHNRYHLLAQWWLQFIALWLGTLHWQPQKCIIIFYRKRGIQLRLFQWERLLPQTKFALPRIRRSQEAASQLPPRMKCPRKLPKPFPTDTRRHSLLLLSPALCFQWSQPPTAFAKKGARLRHTHRKCNENFQRKNKMYPARLRNDDSCSQRSREVWV